MKDLRPKKYITVMILPHTHSEMKQLKIPVRLLYSTLAVVSIIFLMGIWLLYGYFSMSTKTQSYAKLQRENGMQKKEIMRITDDVNRLNSQMENLIVFSKRLQILMGLDTSSEIQNRTGGIEDKEVDRFSSLYKKNQKALLDDIQTDIEQLQKDIPYQQSIHASLNDVFEKNTALLASIPSITPVVGGWITSRFGMRNDPFTGRRKMHYGLDIAQNRNAPVYATADGYVTYAKRFGGLGKMISLDHGYGFTTRYGHLSVILVKFNQKVKRGDIIGRVGSTGRSRGLHLHYEVQIEGVPVNPISFILDRSNG